MGTPSSLDNELSQRTFIFGLRLWVIIGIGVGAFIVLMLLFLSVWLTSRKRSEELPKKLPSYMIPTVSKEIKEVKVDILQNADTSGAPESMLHSVSKNAEEKSMKKNVSETSPKLTFDEGEENPQVERGSLLQISRFEIANRANSPIVDPPVESIAHPSAANPVLPEVSHLGWGHWYTLRDLEAATNYFSDGNVIGEGGYGIVYRGQLTDGALIAVKNLLNNRGQAEREFRVEVEAIGRVRHKNLVRLLGYCVEGSHRMLVYEYVGNGNLEQWLHGHLGEHQSFPWEMRMKIMLGTAKGLAYLHEGLEPKVVHRDVKASNILLDGQWNAKVSDFGLAKLLGSEKSHVTTRVMGTFGYVAPEYASTGLLNERSDVYSFGVLLMEVITGRDPVDYDRPAGEVNLVDWLKIMVASRHSEEVADPKLEVRPSSRALKRALLVALRCVDPDSLKRPKMGQVVHMLEADDFPFHDERRVPRNALRAKADSPDELLHSHSRDGSSHKGN